MPLRLTRARQVLLERLRRILLEDAPHLPQYEAGQDPDWPQWAALPTRDVLTRQQALRGELLGVVRGLSTAQLAREGTHPDLGLLPVAAWLEAFCLHEGHHLHVAWGLVAEAKRKAGPETAAGS